MTLRSESEVALRSTRSQGLANEWVLVLAAEGLTPVVRPRDGAFFLYLPVREAEEASQALDAYERENPRLAHHEPGIPRPGELGEAGDASRVAGIPQAAIAVGVLAATALVVFFGVTGPRAPDNPWFEAGSADAARVLAGEPWRVATALTLHADLPHVAANAAMGAIFVTVVCGAFGSGVGLAAVLLAGMGGNWVNASLHQDFHDAVGASTAIFGAVGLLCGPALLRQRSRGARGRRLWAPLAAGLGLVAMLGVGAAPTDIWAHLFGFGVGVLGGIPLAALRPRERGPGLQILGGALALGILYWCWGMALA